MRVGRWVALGVVAAALVLVALGHLAVLGSRGLDPGTPPTARLRHVHR